MKYFVFENAEGDKKIAGVSVGTFDNLNAAIASYHQKLATARKSDLYKSDLVLVTDAHGTRYDRYVEEYTNENYVEQTVIPEEIAE